MISTALLGVIMGLSPIPPIQALLWLVSYVVGITSWEIMFKRSPFTGTASPYVYFLDNMRASGKVNRFPQVSYLIQALIVMVPVGAATFALGRIIS